MKYSRTSPQRHPWGAEESGRCREVAVIEREGLYMTIGFIFLGLNISILKKVLIVACSYVTQSKYINKTETKQKQTNGSGMDHV